jgi:hypothetical protein
MTPQHFAEPSIDRSLPRSAWGAPDIDVLHEAGQWIIAGQKNRVILHEANLAMAVETGSVTWRMVPSSPEDMLVQWRDERFHLRLADAGKIIIEPHDAGYKTGVKIRLERFHSTGLFSRGLELDLTVVLTVCLEGEAEELVCDAVAIEREASVRQLDWPKEMDASHVNYTVLPHDRGVLLPRDWPEAYGPFRELSSSGWADAPPDTSTVQSNLIECWSMSWWGFQQGESAMMLIVETAADASYQFSHPAGGPTRIGPRWLASLGRLRYPRSVRMAFSPQGDYVTLAKRYRKHVQDTGQFVSLKEKIARTPDVAKLIGAPRVHQWALWRKRAFSSLGDTAEYAYKSTHQEPEDEDGVSVMTFDELAQQLREMKAQGIERCHVILAAWPTHGYDTGHPDPLPPAPPAGGWSGLKRWVETCKDLGYVASLDDEYSDYYVNAPSYDPQFAIHEEDMFSPSAVFGNTKLGGWKEGHIPFMNFWEGGKNAYLSARFATGHVRKNYAALKKEGVTPAGLYFDVLGYVPPSEDFNPEHPLTRREAMAQRALTFAWARKNVGVVGTEAGADWVIPHVDYTCIVREGRAISVPLYNLVYHDAIMTPSGGVRMPLRCLLNGSFPTLYQDPDWDLVRTIAALHARVALLEMTNHEFLDDSYRKERTTFSDGTTVTIDRDAGAYEIDPPLQLEDAG